jgi:tetratricopeptide (TPR) repeat protein
MMTNRLNARTCIVLMLVSGATVCTARAAGSLTEGDRLAAVYDMILRARFDDVGRAIPRTCPPAPPVACQALGVVSVWWQIILDPESHALDAKLQHDSQATISAAEAWTRQEPRRAEAWFYLSGAYAPLTQWQALRGQHLAAARNGNRIRIALEKATQLDPQLHDAYFGIGMYHYWADVAPVAAKLLRVMLFLPGGDRKKGLREMLSARDEGVLLAGEADFQLHWLYLWFEKDPTQALKLIRSLDERYPTNPIFLQRVAEIERDYHHDHGASAAAWEMLLTRAQKGQVEITGIAEARARLGLAHELIDLAQPERAVTLLTSVIESRTTVPYAAQSVAQFDLGVAYNRIGRRDLATAAYNAAIAAAPRDDPSDVRSRARQALKQQPRS